MKQPLLEIVLKNNSEEITLSNRYGRYINVERKKLHSIIDGWWRRICIYIIQWRVISKATIALTKSDSAGFIYLYLSLHVCAHKHIQKKHACTPRHTHTPKHKHRHISLIIKLKETIKLRVCNVQVTVTGGVRVGWKGVGDAIYCNWNHQNEWSLKYCTPKLWLFLIV